jgi:transcriptional regulator GlxA family with amidase domain
MNYLAALKMDTARHLLETMEYPVYRIAEMLAYCDEIHFSRTFKGFTGVSPSAHRRSFQTGAHRPSMGPLGDKPVSLRASGELSS